MSVSRWQSCVQGSKNIGKQAGKLFAKVVCIFDDIPFLLMKDAGSLGSYLLAGAGFLIFPVEGYEGITGLRKAHRAYKEHGGVKRALITASVAKIGFATVGFAASAALLAFVLTNLIVLAAAASVAIPATMAAIGAVELGYNIDGLIKAKQDGTPEKITSAKRKVGYGSAYLGFSLAITALATLSVLTGLGVLSFGIVPSVMLIAVVSVALSVKIFEIVDKKKGFALSNALKNGLHNFCNLFKHDKSNDYQLVKDPSNKVLNDTLGYEHSPSETDQTLTSRSSEGNRMPANDVTLSEQPSLRRRNTK